MTEPEVREDPGTDEEMHEVGADEELTGAGTGQALPPVETAEEEGESEQTVDES